jgi:hypothetical protein
VIVQKSESRDQRNHLIRILLPLGFGKIFLKVNSIVFLDSLGIVFKSIIQLVTDQMILNIGHSFQLMTPYCSLEARETDQPDTFRSLLSERSF